MAFATSILAAVCLRAATISVSMVVVPHFSFKHKLRPYIYMASKIKAVPLCFYFVPFEGIVITQPKKYSP